MKDYSIERDFFLGNIECMINSSIASQHFPLAKTLREDKMRVRVIMGLFSSLFLSSVCLAESYEWYVVTSQDVNNSMIITDKLKANVDLANGWSCVVGQMSVARVVSCVKDGQELEFSVQCDSNSQEDHMQLRFKSKTGGFDFIEVGCKKSEVIG